MGRRGGRACDGWHLLRGPDLSVIEERMPAGSAEARHFHRSSQQFFYVLAGELVLELEGQEHALREADGIEIAPGARHQAINRSGDDARFLVISRPPSHGDRVLAE